MSDDSDAAFLVSYHDKVYDSYSKYILSFFRDGTVSMYDVARKRMFLKRSGVPEEPATADAYIGSTVVVCGRALKVLDFADEATRRKFATTRGATLILVKPDAYGQAGHILDQVTQHKSGALKVGRLRTVHFTAEQARDVLGMDKSRAVSEADVAHLASGVCLAIEVAGDDVIAIAHALVGPAEPADAQAAAPGSIRAKFGTTRVRNAVLTSLALDSARGELAYVLDGRMPPTAVYNRCAVVLVKPHAVVRGLTGQVITSLLQAGLEVSAVRSVVLNRGDAGDLLEHYRSVVSEFERWVGELSSGPCVALEVRPAECEREEAGAASEAAVHAVRELAGPYDPVIAKALRPGTWRAAWGTDVVGNIVHVTDLPRDGPLESKFLFVVTAK